MGDSSGEQAIGEALWMKALVDAVRERVLADGKAPSAKEIISSMALNLGLPIQVMTALSVGIDAMAEYASAPLDDETDSLGEEEEAIVASRRSFLPLLQARLQTRIDRIDERTSGVSRCPTCEKTGESRGRKPRVLKTTFGSVALVRRWSWCGIDSKGWSEAERRLLIPAGRHSARLGESMSLMAAVTSHSTAEELCYSLLGVRVSEHAIQDVVEDRAEAVVCMQDQEAERLRPAEKNGMPRTIERPADAVPVAPRTAYLEVDGVFPMTRELDPTRSEPKPGHRGGKGRRYTMEGKEVKNAVLYTGDDCCTEGDDRGIVLNKKYVSRLGCWLDFAALLSVMMLRLRFDQAETLILLSDGALWIRELAAYYPREVILILDLYHAKHRVWEVANALYGDRTAKTRLWANTQCVYIQNGEVQKVISNLKRLRPKGKKQIEKVDALITYFTNNEDRMDYPAYKAKGWRISSGSVESANYHVTGARLKMQGMRWSIKGAAEMTRLRADWANGIWRQRTREVLAA